MNSRTLIPVISILAIVLIALPGFGGSFRNFDRQVTIPTPIYNTPALVTCDDEMDDALECDGKLVSIKLQYTGDGCDATTNEQEGKVTCTGDAAGTEPVDILVSDGGSRIYADVTGIHVGDIFEATAAMAGEEDFESNTEAVIDNGLQVIEFHTSCSKPLAAGDQFGSLLVVELTSTNGGTVVIGDGRDCELAKATVDPDDLTVLLEGSFCDDPLVRAGQTGGAFEELQILESSENAILVAVDELNSLETCVFQVECECETCHMEVFPGADGTGPPGPEGPAGPQGEDGPEGPAGPTGPTGETGATGSQGPMGPMGLQGEDGTAGAQGATGPQGPMGEDGTNGSPGLPGTDGQQGPAGPVGPTGPAASAEPCDHQGQTTQIGQWCVENFHRSPKNFQTASADCHAVGRTVCPVEALMLCDVLDDAAGNQAGCVSTTDSNSFRFWTSSYDAAYGESVFESIIVYGEDNKAFQAHVMQIYPFYCCESAN